jgi:F-type H+-transporting ATPase subunit b
MKRVGIWLAVWGSALALSWPVLAAEGKTPLPQLDAKQYPGLLFWLVVAFPLLFVLLRFLAVPNVQRAQSSRQEVLRADLKAAEADNEQAKRSQEAYGKTLAGARAGAQEEISRMTAAAAEEDAGQRAIQQQEHSRRLAEAERRVAAFRETAFKEGREAAADLAEAIVGKLVGSPTAKKRV